jgi:glycosyltransferase involved in cell wall biosynthesis
LPSFSAPESHFAKRARESWSFGWHTCRYLGKARIQSDVMYVNAWPLLGQALLARYARRTLTPMVLHVQDIYPESMLLKLPGALRGGAAAVLSRLDRWIANQAAAVVTISQNMHRTYVESRRIPAEKVFMVNNWQDDQLFAALPPRSAACARFGVPEAPFTFIYLGNIGPVAGVDFLIRSFCQAQLHAAQLLIIGGGSAKRAHENLVRDLAATNVRFIPCPDARNVPLLQSMAHICLLPVRKGAAMSSIPSKLMSYMFSARPVLATVDLESDTARVVAEAGCGWVEEPENLGALAAKMREVAALSGAELDQIGQFGRAYALAHHSKRAGARKLADVVMSVVCKQSALGRGSRRAQNDSRGGAVLHA